MSETTTADAPASRRLRLPSFSVQVLAGLVLGVVLGLIARTWTWPPTATPTG